MIRIGQTPTMDVKTRLVANILVGTTVLVLLSGHVAAASDGDDPMAGFGVLLAGFAIALAMIIARRKQRHISRS